MGNGVSGVFIFCLIWCPRYFFFWRREERGFQEGEERARVGNGVLGVFILFFWFMVWCSRYFFFWGGGERREDFNTIF